jgi:hypothetical protein
MKASRDSRIADAIRAAVPSDLELTEREEKLQDQLLAEYSALRSEIDLRMQLRHNDVGAAVVLLGVMTTFAATGDGEPLVLLAFPLLAFFLAVRYVNNDSRIHTLGLFIRENIESRLTGVWWETVWERVRREEQDFHYTRISGLGIFVGTQLLALVTGAAMHFSGSKPNWIMSAVTLTLCVVDLIAVVLTVRFLLGERVQDNEELKLSQVAGE